MIGFRFGTLCIRLLLLLSTAYSSAFSQESPSKSAGPQQDSLQLADWLDVSFSSRLRYEAVDHRFKLGEDPSDQQLPMRTRLGIGIKRITDPFRFFVEFEDSRVFLTDNRSTVNTSMRNEHDLLQAFVAVDFSRKGSKGPKHAFYVGRQSFDLGSRRLFARNRFRNTTNRWDGFRYTAAVPDRWNLDVFFLDPIQAGMDEMDRRAKDTFIWGAFFSLYPRSGGTAELYYFGHYANPQSAGALRCSHTTLGVRLSRGNRAGKLGYDVESAWQFGTVGDMDHFAHFQHLQLGYTFHAPWEPSITGMYDYASGDRNPWDNKSGNFSYLFGARRWEYGPTGILNWMYRSNINSPALFVGLKPTRKLEFLPMLRWLWLAQAKAPWAGTNLVDPSGSSGTDIGKTLELRLRYNFASYFRPEIGYVRFFKGRYPSLVPGSPSAQDSNYFFAELELRFDHLLQWK